LWNFFLLFLVLFEDCDPTFIHYNSSFEVVSSFLVESGLNFIFRGIKLWHNFIVLRSNKRLQKTTSLIPCVENMSWICIRHNVNEVGVVFIVFICICLKLFLFAVSLIL
jgi:hypothetical protein